MNKIYIKKKRKGNVIEFIKNVIYSDRTRYSTKAIRSFYDIECKRKQCDEGSDRSLTDLYKICLSKYPNLTKPKFSSSIIKLCLDDPKFKLMYCNGIRSWLLTCYIRKDKQGKIMQSYLPGYELDEYINKKSKNHIFSMKTLLDFSKYTLDDIM